MSRIPEHLQMKIKEIPIAAGIYMMKDKRGVIMYVGKSKSLRSRVRSYFNSHGRGEKIDIMVHNIYDIDYVVTDTHLEAQILECALIKKLKPQYNTLLKNHNRYIYIKLGEDVRRKPLAIVHERAAESCLGPYRSRRLISDFIDSFDNLYPIIRKDGAYEFDYHIFPGRMDKDTFFENRRNLKEIFTIEESLASFLDALGRKMEAASYEQKYELAAFYRDVSQAVKYICRNNLTKTDVRNSRKILMAEAIKGGCKLFYIVNGRILAKHKFAETELDQKALTAFIEQSDRLCSFAEKYRDEKRDIDFRNIVNVELQDTRGKLVFEMEEDAVFTMEEMLVQIYGLRHAP